MTTNLISARILAGAGCAFLLALPAAARADRVIDAFTDSFPATTLPGSSSPAPVVWTGTLAGSSQPQDSASQDNLTGVLGRQRFAMVEEDSDTNLLVTASSGQGQLSYATSIGSSGVLTLQYGALRDLDADLVSDGGQAFELAIVGDMDNGAQPRPVQLRVTVHSGAASAQATRSLAADGVYQIPFSAFSGIDFADVDFLMFEFDASQVSSVDYTLAGGLRTTGCLQSSGAVRADLFLDTFAAALPLQNLPGAGMQPILWAGTINGVSKNIGVASQTGVPGVIGGQRTTTIAASAISNFLTGVMTRDNATPLFGYATGYPTSGRLTLAYGAQSDLNANLSQMAAFELELSGDLTSGPRPVPLTVTVESGAQSRATQVTLLANGTYYIPFSAFPGVNFADVDYVQFHFDASQVQAVDFDLMGGLRASACVP
jgi:hypothetical protein